METNTKKIKICFTIPETNEKNGVVKVVLNLINLLVSMNMYEITVLSFFSYKYQFHLKDGIKFYELAADDKSRLKLVRYIYAIKGLKKYLKYNHNDLYIIAGTQFVIPFELASFNRKLNKVVWEHRNFNAGPKFRLEWFGKRIALKKYRGILTITKKDFNLYNSHKHNCKLYQIYNLSNFKEDKIGYNIKSRKMVSVGTLSFIKGYDMLLDIAEKILNKYSDWIWDIYGEGELKDYLLKEIEKRHLSGKLNLKGYVENINEVYKDYSFFVFTSRKEGMGMVLYEAQKSHLPIVSFDIECGPSDVIRNQINGYLIDPFYIDKMCEIIEHLINNENERVELSKHSCDCHCEFEKSFIIGKWKGMISEVLNNF